MVILSKEEGETRGRNGPAYPGIPERRLKETGLRLTIENGTTIISLISRFYLQKKILPKRGVFPNLSKTDKEGPLE